MAYGGVEPNYYDDGFDEAGFDRDGYSKNEYDSDGFNPVGIDSFGYNREGLDWEGIDHDGKHHATTTTLFPEEKGIFIAGYEGAGHIWEEIEEYFPNINTVRKREINVGKNQKGEIIVGLANRKSRTFKLFTASTGDDLIVNKSLPSTIKKILGIPEETKRTYKYRKNVKNEEIENLKKEIQRWKLKNESDNLAFLGYKKEWEQWGEDKNREIDKLRLGQTGAGKKSEEEITKFKDENRRLIAQINDREQMINKKNEEDKRWGDDKIKQIEELKKLGKINVKEKEEMEKMITEAIEERNEKEEQFKKNDESMKRGLIKLKEKNERIEITIKKQKEKIENLQKEITELKKEKKKNSEDLYQLIIKKNEEINSLNENAHKLEEEHKENVRKMEGLEKENSLLELQIVELEKKEKWNLIGEREQKEQEQKIKENEQKINDLENQFRSG